VAAAVLFLGLFPTRQYLDQRDTIDDRETELAEVETRIAELTSRIDELESPIYVERQARERFGVVRPGEEAYRLHFPPDLTPDRLLGTE
jgi:cell division protein FtsB